MIECDHIPDNRDEIPTPQVVLNHFHLHDLAGTIQPLDDSCQILLLIGRDLPVAHHVLDQKVGSDRDPYAQQLKLGSNDPNVMSAFPTDDLATSLKDLDLESDDKPLQRSLGLNWDLNNDNFLFRLSSDDKSVTRRGIRSTINSIYDPLGFLAPVILQGKLLLRRLVSETVDWDEPVSDEIATEWDIWKNTEGH